MITFKFQNKTDNRNICLVNRMDGVYCYDLNTKKVTGGPIYEISGKLKSLTISEDSSGNNNAKMILAEKDEGSYYTLLFGLDSHRLLDILSALTDEWALGHLSDIRMRFNKFANFERVSVFAGGRLIEYHRKKEVLEEDVIRHVIPKINALVRALKIPPCEPVSFPEKYGYDPFDLQDDAEYDFSEKSHVTTLPFLRCRQGRNLVCAFSRSILKNVSPSMGYRCYTEFDIGGVFVDAAIELLDFQCGMRERICCELKVSKSDLRGDKKFEAVYLNSGMFNYYLLVASTRDVAEAALKKYVHNPYVGVGCLETGEILRIPQRKVCDIGKERLFAIELENRRRKLLGGVADPLAEHYDEDRKMMFLMMNEAEQTIPPFKLEK